MRRKGFRMEAMFFFDFLIVWVNFASELKSPPVMIIRNWSHKGPDSMQCDSDPA